MHRGPRVAAKNGYVKKESSMQGSVPQLWPESLFAYLESLRRMTRTELA